jgi:transcription-repair coupling factor (superfamily II helicase)
VEVKESILARFEKHNESWPHDTERRNYFLDGLSGSSVLFYIASSFKSNPMSILYVADDKDKAAYSYDTLMTLLGGDIMLLTDSFRRPGNFVEINTANVLRRSEVASTLVNGVKPNIIVAYPESIFEMVVNPVELDKDKITVKVGEKFDRDFVIEILIEYGFERVDFVYEPGQFSLRGAIVDIFSFGNGQPYRIEMDDDKVESIRIFDPETQLSIKNVDFLNILPNANTKFEAIDRIPLFEILKGDCQIVLEDRGFITERMAILYEKAEEIIQSISMVEQPESQKFFKDRSFISPEMWEKSLNKYSVFHLTKPDDRIKCQTLNFETKPHPVISKQFKLLVTHLEKNEHEGIETWFFSENARQIKRLESILTDLGAKNTFQPVIGSIHEGFLDTKSKIEILTDHQIFQRYHQYSLKSGYTRDQAVTLRMLKELQPGDYVTHIDHGVGKFSGLETIEIGGVKQESVRIIYRNNDMLYVSINSLHKLSKYMGKEGEPPMINKLGSDTWKNLKQKTKSKVKDIAKGLINLYAKRRASEGIAFSPDGYLQVELEASFLYEDTPDQYKSTIDVKEDMEKPYPMDRLICGDVGFGKTEVAIRAAFKAINDGYQVAILVPTTILALQHYHTFHARLKDFGVEVDYLNRFKTTKEKKEVYEGLQSGKIDLVIGTHALLNKDVHFKNLGLLVIDEEQKFGVQAKEKIRSMKVNVDTLTLTATPIPRTLQFSLMAARDLSVIRTPPPNRQPIYTEIRLFEQRSIREAIENELGRGGQVFFVHDRVKNLGEIGELIAGLVPDASVAIAHGQMDSKILEATLVDFIEGKFDILVSTNIIETGLDIPNANTMIINNAHHYGLSDLHQLRGRVGRSNKKAYCYLISPPMSTLTPEAKKRLKTIVEFSELGSGFEIAMRDLDIRGSGNLLGGEQSGFISEMGYDAFQRVLEEAIQELKEDEFKEVFKNEIDKKKIFVKDVTIETDSEMLIPNYYVSSTSERLSLYHEMDAIEDEDTLQKFLTDLSDRFGSYPDAVDELADGLRMRWLLRILGFERAVIKNGSLNAYFPSNPQSPYYESETFLSLFQYLGVMKDPKVTVQKTLKNLVLRVKGIKNIQSAMQFFESLTSTISS